MHNVNFGSYRGQPLTFNFISENMGWSGNYGQKRLIVTILLNGQKIATLSAILGLQNQSYECIELRNRLKKTLSDSRTRS